MNESEYYLIRFSDNFDKSYEKLVRDRYRKNRVAATEFAELIQKWIEILSVDPRPRPPLGHLEPWPRGINSPCWELWKLVFKMPQLRGAAGQGRIIYLLNTKAQKIVLAWIYTHAEFEGRPPNQAMKRVFLEAMESQPVSDENDLSETAESDDAKDREA